MNGCPRVWIFRPGKGRSRDLQVPESSPQEEKEVSTSDALLCGPSCNLDKLRRTARHRPAACHAALPKSPYCVVVEVVELVVELVVEVVVELVLPIGLEVDAAEVPIPELDTFFWSLSGS